MNKIAYIIKIFIGNIISFYNVFGKINFSIKQKINEIFIFFNFSNTWQYF